MLVSADSGGDTPADAATDVFRALCVSRNLSASGTALRPIQRTSTGVPMGNRVTLLSVRFLPDSLDHQLVELGLRGSRRVADLYGRW